MYLVYVHGTYDKYKDLHLYRPYLSWVHLWSIPLTICSIFIFIYFYQKRRKLTVHLPFNFLLVLISFLQIMRDLPFVMIYYRRGEVAVSANSFWLWWKYSTSSLLIFTMAWGCIERHFLIFYTSVLSTRRKRFFFHVLPMVVACIYPLIFYFAVIVFNTCENQWDFQMVSTLSHRNETVWVESMPLTCFVTFESIYWTASMIMQRIILSLLFFRSFSAFKHAIWSINRLWPHSIS